ncbi:tyrosine-protein phosphatase [Spirillospora sp. NPDC052242]
MPPRLRASPSPAFSRGLDWLLTTIADDQGIQLFRCTAEKDRTGWAIAVLLTLRGVPRDKVMRRPAQQRPLLPLARRAGRTRCHAARAGRHLPARPRGRTAHLQAGFDQVTASNESVLNYATKGLSPQILAKLRHKLLVAQPPVLLVTCLMVSRFSAARVIPGY